jgi:hypothetical protein
MMAHNGALQGENGTRHSMKNRVVLSYPSLRTIDEPSEYNAVR